MPVFRRKVEFGIKSALTSALGLLTTKGPIERVLCMKRSDVKLIGLESCRATWRHNETKNARAPLFHLSAQACTCKNREGHADDR